MDRWTLRRRMRAARELGGFERAEDLAKAIGQRGLGKSRLYEIEQGRGAPPEERDLWAIANACGLPLAWFEVDIAAAIAAAAKGPSSAQVSSDERRAAEEEALRIAEEAAQQRESKSRRRTASDQRRGAGGSRP